MSKEFDPVAEFDSLLGTLIERIEQATMMYRARTEAIHETTRQHIRILRALAADWRSWTPEKIDGLVPEAPRLDREDIRRGLLIGIYSCAGTVEKIADSLAMIEYETEEEK